MQRQVFRRLQSTVPVRKAINADLKKRRPKRRTDDGWELTVGIEIHAQLNADRKLFSNARTTGTITNTRVAQFDNAIPGTQPLLSSATVLPALRAALALNCEVAERSSFDRKHYFYWDQPAGYQITQYYAPFAKNGSITIDGQEVAIKQIQLEQDTAKTLSNPDEQLVDFNRVSHPLIEIISHPVMHDPVTAANYVRKVQSILKAVGAATLGMELGGLRADVNVSVRREGPLGQRCEIKNLSSIKAVHDAIVAERDRQIEVLENGGTVASETRGWTLGAETTHALRSKEGEVDYRYMPDPDIGDLWIEKALVERVRETLPLGPDAIIEKLKTYNLNAKDAQTLIEADRVDYLEQVTPVRLAGNWVLHELGRMLARYGDNQITPQHMSAILKLLDEKQITGSTARHLLSLPFEGDFREPADVVETENLRVRVLSEEELRELAAEVVAESAGTVKSKGEGKVKYLVGQIMRRAEGTIDARAAEAMIRQLL